MIEFEVLDTLYLNFQELTVGDSVKFLLEKRNGFHVDNELDDTGWPRTSSDVTIRLRNGIVIKSKEAKTRILDSDEDYGIYARSTVTEIVAPDI